MRKIFVPTSNAGKLREFDHAFASKNMECIGLNFLREIANEKLAWQTPTEDRQTFLGNGWRKLSAALEIFPALKNNSVNSVLVDDSGLCVPRLNFAPGVHSASFAGTPRDDRKNREFLIEKLKVDLGLMEKAHEPAFFVCSILSAEHILASQENIPNSEVIGSEQVLHRLEELEPKVMAMVNQRLGSVPSAAYGYQIKIEHDSHIYQLNSVIAFCTGFVATYEQELLPGEGHGYDAMFFPMRSPQLSFASIPLAEKNQMSHRSEAIRGFTLMEKSHIAPGEILELF